MNLKKIDKQKIKDHLKILLSEKRYVHSLGTETKAVELAEQFNVDKEKASIAGLLHDCAKYINLEHIQEFFEKNSLPIPPSSDEKVSTLHSIAGEYIAKTEYNIDDLEILSAIRKHTIGCINMNTLDKIIFIADKIEDYTRHNEHADRIRMTLSITGSLNETILTIYTETFTYLIENRRFINSDAILNWNALLKEHQLHEKE